MNLKAAGALLIAVGFTGCFSQSLGEEYSQKVGDNSPLDESQRKEVWETVRSGIQGEVSKSDILSMFGKLCREHTPAEIVYGMGAISYIQRQDDSTQFPQGGVSNLSGEEAGSTVMSECGIAKAMSMKPHTEELQRAEQLKTLFSQSDKEPPDGSSTKELEFPITHEDFAIDLFSTSRKDKLNTFSEEEAPLTVIII